MKNQNFKCVLKSKKEASNILNILTWENALLKMGYMFDLHSFNWHRQLDCLNLVHKRELHVTKREFFKVTLCCISFFRNSLS